MAIEYLKTPLTYAAVAVVATVVIKHPGGEATIKHFSDGHVEIVSSFEVDLSEVDRQTRLLRRFSEGTLTTPSSASATIKAIKSI